MEDLHDIYQKLWCAFLEENDYRPALSEIKSVLTVLIEDPEKITPQLKSQVDNIVQNYTQGEVREGVPGHIASADAGTLEAQRNLDVKSKTSIGGPEEALRYLSYKGITYAYTYLEDTEEEDYPDEHKGRAQTYLTMSLKLLNIIDKPDYQPYYQQIKDAYKNYYLSLYWNEDAMHPISFLAQEIPEINDIPFTDTDHESDTDDE